MTLIYALIGKLFDLFTIFANEPLKRKMMKKNHLNRLFATLMVGLLSIGCITFWSCQNEDEEFLDYPEGAVLPKGDEAKPFKAIELKGTLSFDEELQKWVIEPNLDNIWCLTGFIFPIYAITNMSDEYKLLEGKVVYSGIVKRRYYLGNKSYCTIKLTGLSPLEAE